MSEVLFVSPTSERKLTHECEGTLLLATILKEKGIDADIYRFYEADSQSGFEAFVNDTAKNILSRNPKIVSFYCRCDCFLTDIRIAEKIKAANSEITIVFGGPQADAVSAELLSVIKSVDYCCSGEGEETVYPLFSGILNGTDVTATEGLTYRNEQGKAVTNKRPQLRKCLDDISFTDYSFIDDETIRYAVANNLQFPLEVGRGCPYNCAYCSTSLFWQRKFRIKSPRRIIEEIIRVKEKYGITRFSFQHDLFTANKKSVLEFCSQLKENSLDIKWVCSSRTDTIDAEMIEAMVSAGLTGIYFGIETGSPRMQDIIHKKLDIQHVVDVCRLLVDKNVSVTASFIYGFPEETEEDLEQTLQLISELKAMGVKYFQLHLCAMFPGTEYYDKYKNELVFADVYSDQVSDFGVRENYDYICEHKNLFPFYYEYHNEFRDRFAHLREYGLKCISLFDDLKAFDREKFSHKTLTEFYLEVTDASKADIESAQRGERPLLSMSELANNYLPTAGFDETQLAKLQEYYRFVEDSNSIHKIEGDVTEIKNYAADISAFRSKKSLSEIEMKPSMVIFRKVGKKVTMVVY